MAYDARAVEVMIASPSDVHAERTAVREVLTEWNAVHSRGRGLVLLPLAWDTHSAPDLAGRPQEIINERVLARADVLVGIFWTRVGSPTGKAISGSVEEIEEHRRVGKPVMLFFSDQPVAPQTLDPDQYAKLKEFKAWAQGQGLVASFESVDDFKAQFSRALQLNLSDNPYLASQAKPRSAVVVADLTPRPVPTLSSEALEMLKAAAIGNDNNLMMFRSLSGTHISAGRKNFGDPADRRSIAKWEAAIEQLSRIGFIKDINGEGQIFELTNAGFEAADSL
jgi:hypothetical protein